MIRSAAPSATSAARRTREEAVVVVTPGFDVHRRRSVYPLEDPRPRSETG